MKSKFFFICLVTVSLLYSCERDISPSPSIQLNSSQTGKAVGKGITCNNENIQRHIISLEYAYKMIDQYQKATKNPGSICDLLGENGWVYAETFPKEAIQMILNQEECCKYRIYNGIDEDKRLHFIMVGVNSNNEDILFRNKRSSGVGDSNGIELPIIIEMGLPCPEACGGVYVTK